MERVIESGYYQVWIPRPSYFTPLFRQYQTYQCLQGRTVTRKWCTCHTDHTQESVDNIISETAQLATYEAETLRKPGNIF